MALLTAHRLQNFEINMSNVLSAYAQQTSDLESKAAKEYQVSRMWMVLTHS